MSKQETLIRLFSGDRQLPTLPVLFTEFTKLMENPLVSNKKVAELIMKDQSMVVKVLKLCNSAIYSNRQEITNLTNAITFLGLGVLRNLILQISLVRLFPLGKYNIPEFDITVFWEHSLASAYYTDLLARRLKLPHNENYYIAGLTHDIGKLAIYQFHPEHFARAVSLLLETGKNDYEVETEVMGVDHTDVGAFLAEKWKFKAEITEAIRCHHHGGESCQRLCSALTRIANFFAKASGFCFPWDQKVINIVEDPAWKILTDYCDEVDVERITFELIDEAAKIHELVGELLSRRG